jgi:hypothetical protein
MGFWQVVVVDWKGGNVMDADRGSRLFHPLFLVSYYATPATKTVCSPSKGYLKAVCLYISKQ